jgi:hypothetical protein
MRFPGVLVSIILLGAIVLFLNRAFGDSLLVRFACWLLAALVSLLLSFWLLLGHS